MKTLNRIQIANRVWGIPVAILWGMLATGWRLAITAVLVCGCLPIGWIVWWGAVVIDGTMRGAREAGFDVRKTMRHVFPKRSFGQWAWNISWQFGVPMGLWALMLSGLYRYAAWGIGMLAALTGIVGVGYGITRVLVGAVWGFSKAVVWGLVIGVGYKMPTSLGLACWLVYLAGMRGMDVGRQLLEAIDRWGADPADGVAQAAIPSGALVQGVESPESVWDRYQAWQTAPVCPPDMVVQAGLWHRLGMQLWVMPRMLPARYCPWWMAKLGISHVPYPAACVWHTVQHGRDQLQYVEVQPQSMYRRLTGSQPEPGARNLSQVSWWRRWGRRWGQTAEGRDPNQQIVLICLDGDQYLEEMYAHFQQWANATRCLVVGFNYRGVGRSVGSISAPADLVADACIVWEHLRDRYQISGSGIHLVGRDVGGWVAVQCAQWQLAMGSPIGDVWVDCRSRGGVYQMVFQSNHRIHRMWSTWWPEWVLQMDLRETERAQSVSWCAWESDIWGVLGYRIPQSTFRDPEAIPPVLQSPGGRAAWVSGVGSQSPPAQGAVGELLPPAPVSDDAAAREEVAGVFSVQFLSSLLSVSVGILVDPLNTRLYFVSSLPSPKKYDPRLRTIWAHGQNIKKNCKKSWQDMMRPRSASPVITKRYHASYTLSSESLNSVRRVHRSWP